MGKREELKGRAGVSSSASAERKLKPAVSAVNVEKSLWISV